MRTRLILSAMGIMMLTAVLLFQFSSCSKSANGNLTKDQTEQLDTNLAATPISDKDYTESDSDLTTVDYKQFYDQLAPKGEWIQVKAEEIGMKPKTTAYNSSGNNHFSLSSLLGVNVAYGLADADMGMVFVWRPSPDLGVTVVAGDEPPVYRPYSHGRWENTDAGWYFRASNPEEETTSHYGRWCHTDNAGWLWVPGRVWSPAWVNWRQNDDYVSWAPLQPSEYLDDGTMDNEDIDNDDYMIVERRHFLDPDIYEYDRPYYDDGSRILVSGFNFTIGIVIVNDEICNRGPDVTNIYNIYGRDVDMINIHHCRDFSEVRYSDRDYNVFTPSFRRHDNGLHNGYYNHEPKSFMHNDVWKERKPDEKFTRKEGKKSRDDNNSNINGQKDNSLRNGDQNMGRVKGNQNSGSVKGDQNTGRVKGNQNTGRVKGNQNTGKVKGDQNTGRVKGNQNTGKVKGNQNTGKVKGNQNTGKVKGKQNTGKVKGNQNTGKVKGKQNTGKVKGNQNTGKVKGNQNTGKVKGNQNTGKVKGNQNTGKVKGNQNTGNNKGNKQNGNDKGKKK